MESFQKGSNRSDINGTKSALRTNPLVIPDEYMRSFQTIFLIRDPRLVLFSLIKAHKDSWPEYRTKFAMFLNSNLQFVRDAHAWLASEAAEGNCPEPLIVDSEDVINNSETLQRLCDRTGLDKSRIRYEWEAMPEEVLSKLPIAGQRFLAEISRSTGVVPSRLRADLGSEKERASWRKELGEEDAEVLEGFVERAMPHYEHLYARRLQG